MKVYEIWALQDNSGFRFKLRSKDYNKIQKIKEIIEDHIKNHYNLWIKQYNSNTMYFTANIIFTYQDQLEIRENIISNDFYIEPFFEIH